MQFFGAAARIANDEDRRMRVARMAARDIGIQALNLVRQPHILQEIQRAIHCGRFGSTLAIEIGQQIVGFGRLAAFQQ